MVRWDPAVVKRAGRSPVAALEATVDAWPASPSKDVVSAGETLFSWTESGWT